MITPLSFAIIVTGVGQSILDVLAVTPESGGVPGRKCLLVPGTIAADGCDCGQLALTIQRIVPSDVYPADSSNSPVRGPCNSRGLFADCLAVLFRCTPGPDTQGRPPSCAKLLESGLRWSGDEYAMRKGIECYLSELRSNRPQGVIDFRVGTASSIGPEGNCVGVGIPFSFYLM